MMDVYGYIIIYIFIYMYTIYTLSFHCHAWGTWTYSEIEVRVFSMVPHRGRTVSLICCYHLSLQF